MPEFFIQLGDQAREFARLDAFTQGYVEALFFTNCSSSDDGDLAGKGFMDLASESLELIVGECAAFQATANVAELIEGREIEAGRDFWFTRCGHGCGFWDGDWPKAVGGFLTFHAMHAGNRDVYLGDDKKVYLS
jgi:hypothetical protein